MSDLSDHSFCQLSLHDLIWQIRQNGSASEKGKQRCGEREREREEEEMRAE